MNKKLKYTIMGYGVEVTVDSESPEIADLFINDMIKKPDYVSLEQQRPGKKNNDGKKRSLELDHDQINTVLHALAIAQKQTESIKAQYNGIILSISQDLSDEIKKYETLFYDISEGRADV